MKPTSPATLTHNPRDSFASPRMRSLSVRTDCCFQPSAPDFSGGGKGEGAPSFRGISAAYFDGEARSHLKIEAVVFGVIALTAAVPVFESVSGLVRFVYGALL